jgi:hypothetical protein
VRVGLLVIIVIVMIIRIVIIVEIINERVRERISWCRGLGSTFIANEHGNII